MLLRQSIAALTSFGLEGFDGEAGLFHRAGHEPADGVTLPAHGFHDLGDAGPAFLPWGAFLAAGAFLADLLFTGAPLADCAPAFGLRVAFGFAGATSGLAASPKLWMRAQMRLAAVVASLNFLVGFSPGKLFRIANRRSAGQPAANSASSCSLVKLSNGVCTATDASSGVENATISFVSLIVNVVTLNLLWPRSARPVT